MPARAHTLRKDFSSAKTKTLFLLGACEICFKISLHTASCIPECRSKAAGTFKKDSRLQTMINSIIRNRLHFRPTLSNISDIIDDLIKSRNLFNIQTIQYDLITVTSMDIDDSGTFLLVGLSNGGIDLLEVEDPRFGTVSPVSRRNFSQFNLNRVQWSPNNEQFFSMLDNHDLLLTDPSDMRIIEKFAFAIKTNWSEWNPNDQKMIAVCGSESQVRLVDIRSGSSVQTIILAAPSRLASHRSTRCLWSPNDLNCLIVGDNEGYLHVYDTRRSSRALVLDGEERGQISGMSFTKDGCSIITTQGTENHLVQWCWDKCRLRPDADKFQPRERVTENVVEVEQQVQSSRAKRTSPISLHSDRKRQKLLTRKNTGRVVPLPVDAYIRCQFHVTDRHILCPVPPRSKKSKEIYIYDLKSGARIKTLKSDGILNRGVFSVSSLMPESLTIFIGGRERLRVWSIDEDYQRRMEEKAKRYHQTRWESDDETT